jgi:hypothetical protein
MRLPDGRSSFSTLLFPNRVFERDVWTTGVYLDRSLGPPVAVECQEAPLPPAIRYAADTRCCEVKHTRLVIKELTVSSSSAWFSRCQKPKCACVLRVSDCNRLARWLVD